MAGETAGYYGDPWARVAGIQGGGAGNIYAMGAGGGGSATAGVDSAFSLPGGASLMQQLWGAQLGEKQYEAQTRNAADAAMWSGLSSMGSSLTGGFSSGGMAKYK